MAGLEVIPMSGMAASHRCVCGSRGDACTCAELAAGFLRRGFAEAAACRLHAALANIQVCRTLIPDEVTAAEAAGLCAFALGDVREAARAWGVAAQYQPDGAASAWLASMEGGTVRSALVRYNEALEAARNEQWGLASELSREVHRQLPDFLPSIQLHALTLAALDRIEEARKVLQAGHAAVSDDGSTTAMLASLPQPTATPRPPVKGWGLATAAVLFLAFSAVVVMTWGGSDTVVQEAPAAAVPQSTPADDVGPASQQSAPPVSNEAGLEAYRVGRDLLEGGQPAAASSHLAAAAAAPATAYFHDDALYLLAKATEATGDQQAAVEAAGRLVREHPTSLFNNSYIRRLAEDAPR